MGFRDVSNSYGRKGQPRVKAVCERCDREEVICCPKGAEGRAVKKIREMGWSLIGKVMRCPKCEAKRKVVNMSQKEKTADTARQPTRAQRRSIMDLLTDVYDVQNERYHRGDTDDTLADVLGVMPGWVAGIREEFFGTDGGNEDITALTDQCRAFLKDARALVAKRDKETDAMSVSIKQVEGIAEQLDKIKRAVSPRAIPS